jgi:hypothetical protein
VQPDPVPWATFDRVGFTIRAFFLKRMCTPVTKAKPLAPITLGSSSTADQRRNRLVSPGGSNCTVANASRPLLPGSCSAIRESSTHDNQRTTPKYIADKAKRRAARTGCTPASLGHDGDYCARSHACPHYASMLQAGAILGANFRCVYREEARALFCSRGHAGRATYRHENFQQSGRGDDALLEQRPHSEITACGFQMPKCRASKPTTF